MPRVCSSPYCICGTHVFLHSTRCDVFTTPHVYLRACKVMRRVYLAQDRPSQNLPPSPSPSSPRRSSPTSQLPQKQRWQSEQVAKYMFIYFTLGVKFSACMPIICIFCFSNLDLNSLVPKLSSVLIYHNNNNRHSSQGGSPRRNRPYFRTHVKPLQGSST